MTDEAAPPLPEFTSKASRTDSQNEAGKLNLLARLKSKGPAFVIASSGGSSAATNAAAEDASSDEPPIIPLMISVSPAHAPSPSVAATATPGDEKSIDSTASYGPVHAALAPPTSGSTDSAGVEQALSSSGTPAMSGLAGRRPSRMMKLPTFTSRLTLDRWEAGQPLCYGHRCDLYRRVLILDANVYVAIVRY